MFMRTREIAVETFHDSIHDVLEDLGCEKHGVLCSELNEYFKSLMVSSSLSGRLRIFQKISIFRQSK